MNKIEQLAEFDFVSQDVFSACEMTPKQLEYIEKLGLEFTNSTVRGRSRIFPLSDIWRLSIIADLTLGGMTRAASVKIMQDDFDFADKFWLNRDAENPSFLVTSAFGFRPDPGSTASYSTSLVIGANAVVPLLRSKTDLTVSTHVVNVSLRLGWTELDLIERLQSRGKWSE